MFTPLLSELLDMHGKAAEPASPSELPPSHTGCTLTFNNALLPWWSPSNFFFFFFDGVFCLISITIMFPHHCRPNLGLAGPLAPSTAAKLPQVLSWGSATPLPVVMGTGPGERPPFTLPGSKGKGRTVPCLLRSPPSLESQREAEARGAEDRRGGMAQVGKDTRGRCAAKGAEVLDSCVPPRHTPPAHAPAEGELGERGTGAELQPGDIWARGRAEGELRCCSRTGLREATSFLKKRVQRLLQSWFSGASLSNAMYGAGTHCLLISKRISCFLKYFR